MNKEDILKAARKEKGNQDLVEEHTSTEAGFWSHKAGVLLCLLVMVMSRLITGRIETGCIVVFMGMRMADQLYRLHRDKSRANIIITVINVVAFIVVLVLHTLVLTGSVQQ